MVMRTALCIGGPIDGDTRTAHGTELVVPLRIPMNSAAYLMHPETRDTAQVECRRARYRYEQINFHTAEPIGIWVFSELTFRDALQSALTAYADAIAREGA